MSISWYYCLFTSIRHSKQESRRYALLYYYVSLCILIALGGTFFLILTHFQRLLAPFEDDLIMELYESSIQFRGGRRSRKVVWQLAMERSTILEQSCNALDRESAIGGSYFWQYTKTHNVVVIQSAVKKFKAWHIYTVFQ